MKCVLFVYTNLINNTWKDIGSFFVSLVSNIIIHLSVFLVHACENYIYSYIYFLWLFLALKLLILHGMRDMCEVEY